MGDEIPQNIINNNTRVRVNFPPYARRCMAVDTQPLGHDVGNLSALAGFFQEMDGWPLDHYVDPTNPVAKVVWNGDCSGTLLEQLDRIWRQDARAVLFVNAIPKGQTYQQAYLTVQSVMNENNKRPRFNSEATQSSLESFNAQEPSGGPSTGASNQTLPNPANTSASSPVVSGLELQGLLALSGN